jgi:hypothetical protein
MAGSGRKNADAVLIAALAGGKTIRAAAETADVSERTVYRRLESAAFRSGISTVRAQMLSEAVGLLTSAASGAVATLMRLLTAESPSVQLGAARSILELGTRLREGEELERRIAELERLLQSEQPHVP